MEKYSIKKYLPDTALNVEHPRAVKMREILEVTCAENDGQLVSFEVEDGVATIQVKGENALQFIIDEFNKLDGIEVQKVSLFQDLFQRNRAQQDKVNKKRANKKEKKEEKIK